MHIACRAISYGLAITVAGAALAHHGFGGSYDRAAPVYLEGTVADAYFGQPHPEVELQVDTQAQLPTTLPTDAEEFAVGLQAWSPELAETVTIEFPPVGRFFDLDGRVAVGDRVALIALRNCEAPHQLRGQWIALADGTEVVRQGTTQTEVTGC
ncbi:DUF6152 family protein [Tabrizicola sp.]|uniref:DUF6152 family protein n=1 Tax=Tabrizicola sp. TaxID=2005166 RepID=UPI003F3BF1E4